MKKSFIAALLIVLAGTGAWAQNYITVQENDFDYNYLYPEEWTIAEGPGTPGCSPSGSCEVYVDAATSILVLDTSNGSGNRVIHGTRTASVSDGRLVFSARIYDAYAENSAVYGNAQPRGLANGADRNNAIEFINVNTNSGDDNEVQARTVKNGTATTTNFTVFSSVRIVHQYVIVARPNQVKFYVDGVLAATHTTNIPTVPLNILFGTGDSGFGNVPHTIDNVSFQVYK